MLANVFSVELWERFSFYGMQAVVLLYMYFAVDQGGLGGDRTAAVGIMGAYGGGVYLSTILGAWVADRLLGSERVLFISAVLIMLGHIALAVLPGWAGVGVGLLLVAIGSGGLKANATSIVGTLYAAGDERRDAGFSIFYMGINIGALFGPLLTGLVRDTVGFHWAFALAAVGMAIGLVQYGLTRKNLPAEAGHVPNPLPRNRYGLAVGIAAAAIVVIVVAVLTGLITPGNLATLVVIATIVAAVAYFAVILSSNLTPTERRRVYAFIPIFIASAVFWSLYQQQFSMLTIYSDTRLNRNLFGWEMPIEWVQSINPVFIIVLSGVFAALWTRLGARQPSTPTKFTLSLVIMGVAFLAFLPFVGTGTNGTPLLVIAFILLLFTFAELLLSPIGLSVTTKLAPERFRTQMVALFFLSVALGSSMAGILAGHYDPTNEAPYFAVIGGVCIVVGVLLGLAIKPIRKLMSGVH
ncbi:MFS transporter [Tersicoccus solisilvae]|uniref:MFS transporter n=2 Tax=Tersicoccus solisilvae TaxID=1882339 RepID=A0ABQ1NM15_9MICC|nr:MFS transporter [Tersicoccus solisilvae]